MGAQRQMNTCIIFFPRVGEHHRRVSKKFVRAKCWGGHCFLDMTRPLHMNSLYCGHTCIRSAQGQDSHHSSMAEGRAHKTPLMSGELLAGDGYFRGVIPGWLISLAPVDGPIPVYMDNTSWIQWDFLKNDINLGEEHLGRRVPGRVRRKSRERILLAYTVHIMNFSKNK